MSKFVLALTGPTGSGKTTIGEKLSKKLERCVNIDADHVKHMIVSGFHKDDSNAGDWSFNQWALAGDSIGLLASNFLKEGYSVVINGYIDEPGWSSIQEHVDITCKILLLPQLETVVDRDAGRTSEVAMGKESVIEHHQTFSSDPFYQDFTKLDTTNHTVDETVETVLGIVS